MARTLVHILLGGTAGFLLVFTGLCVHHLLVVSPWFSVESIHVTGVKRMTPGEAVALSGLHPGDNIFSVDLEASAQRIGASPWVREVRVRRALPQRIEIQVTEWEPAAVVGIGSKTVMADAEGRMFAAWGPARLPRVTCTRGGEEGLAEGVGALLRMTDAAPAARLDGKDGVTLIGRDGRTIHLGWGGTMAKQQRAEAALRVLRARNLDVLSLDADYADRVFARVKTD